MFVGRRKFKLLGNERHVYVCQGVVVGGLDRMVESGHWELHGNFMPGVVGDEKGWERLLACRTSGTSVPRRCQALPNYVPDDANLYPHFLSDSG